MTAAFLRATAPGQPDSISLQAGSAGAKGLDEQDERWVAVQRIVNSPTFAKSARLSQLLLHVAERGLQGRLNELTEQQLGIHVFGRPADYNPGDDTIVRGTARHLRHRLALYYVNEGQADPVRVSIPTGAYAPAFEFRSPPSLSSPEQLPAAAAVSQSRGFLQGLGKPSRLAWGLSVLVPVLVPILLVRQSESGLKTATRSSRLWRQMFTADRSTLVVAGDAGLNIFENMARRQVSVDEYASKSYLSDREAKTPAGYLWDPLALREYSPISDMRVTARLLDLPEARKAKALILFARDLKIDDLRQNNLILIGSPMYNPWEQMFDPDANFSIQYDGDTNEIRVRNKNPRPGERGSYAWRADDPDRTGYALICLTDNLMKTGRVLLLEGTTVMGSAAAADFVFSPEMSKLLEQAQGGDGKTRNFEVLLETRFKGGASSHSRIVAARIY